MNIRFGRTAAGSYCAAVGSLSLTVHTSLTKNGCYGWTAEGDGFYVSSTSDKYRTAQAAKDSCKRALIAIMGSVRVPQ